MSEREDFAYETTGARNNSGNERVDFAYKTAPQGARETANTGGANSAYVEPRPPQTPTHSFGMTNTATPTSSSSWSSSTSNVDTTHMFTSQGQPSARNSATVTTSAATGPGTTARTTGGTAEPWPDVVSFTIDPQPVPDKCYFRTASKRKVDLAVCIPCYNEAGYDIRRTLIDLDNNFRLADVESTHVVVVIDGISKMSETMRDTFIQDLGFSVGMTALTSRADIDLEKTYFLDRDHNHDSRVMTDPRFEISCIVKGTNRKKHNSQEWFLRGFCPIINPRIAFLVDCGTCFDPYCVLYLMHSLDKEPGVIAVSGRARVMSVSRQTPEHSDGRCLCLREDQRTGLCCIRSCLRNVQRYEMEAMHVVDKPIFSALGFLPVIPGPCFMLRYQNEDPELQRNLLQGFDWFFDFVHQTPEVAQLVGANLILAEDRVLSYAIPISTGLKTKWVHHALFYFDAETETEGLARQRRRWGSGTIAGHLWLFNNIFKSTIIVNKFDSSLAPLVNRLPRCRRLALRILIGIEVLKLGFNTVSPTVFLLGVYYGINVIFNALIAYDPALAVSGAVMTFLNVTIPILILTFLMMFIVRHSTLKCGKFSGKVYDKGFFVTMTVMGVFMSAGAIYAIYSTLLNKINQWDNDIRVGFTYNSSDMTNIDVQSRDYVDGVGRYMVLSEFIFPPGFEIEPTHPLDGKFTPLGEVFQSYQELSHDILSEHRATMLTFTYDAFQALTHPVLQTMQQDMEDMAEHGWEHYQPFCNLSMTTMASVVAWPPWPPWRTTTKPTTEPATTQEGCIAANTMSQLMASWTVPHAIASINDTCPHSVLTSWDAEFAWHISCHDWDLQHWMELALLILMLLVLFLPILTHLAILELAPVFWLVIGFLPYYLYLPTMVGAFGTYSIAQMNNLSWGNRQTKFDSEEEAGTAEMRHCVNRVVVGVIIANIVFTGFVLITPDDATVFIAAFALINVPAMAEAFCSFFVLIFHYWCCCRRFRCFCRRGECCDKCRKMKRESVRHRGPSYLQMTSSRRPSGHSRVASTQGSIVPDLESGTEPMLANETSPLDDGLSPPIARTSTRLPPPLPLERS